VIKEKLKVEKKETLKKKTVMQLPNFFINFPESEPLKSPFSLSITHTHTLSLSLSLPFQS